MFIAPRSRSDLQLQEAGKCENVQYRRTWASTWLEPETGQSRSVQAKQLVLSNTKGAIKWKSQSFVLGQQETDLERKTISFIKSPKIWQYNSFKKRVPERIWLLGPPVPASPLRQMLVQAFLPIKAHRGNYNCSPKGVWLTSWTDRRDWHCPCGTGLYRNARWCKSVWVTVASASVLESWVRQAIGW